VEHHARRLFAGQHTLELEVVERDAPLEDEHRPECGQPLRLVLRTPRLVFRDARESVSDVAVLPEELVNAWCSSL
jgi:hypothetical protein